MAFLYDTSLPCKSFRSLAHSQIKLHCIKVGKLDVRGSLVFSNPVTYDDGFEKHGNFHERPLLINFHVARVQLARDQVPASL